ncbi:hypothetical protein [Neofamilia massiliensis]|uniref:hypothetical protein n=1 Tax=Neofamilia massiliensis TaxID=1673724 RepID=UPI00096AD967|nr:hypothetical protein [Neofamilia massiliensis]
MKYKLDYLKVDPAGNITAFIIGDVDPSHRAKIANIIIDDYDPSVEQVGFISKKADGTYRMDMMGGEFCANASRSFGLYLAKTLDLFDEDLIEAEVSGSKDKVQVKVDKDRMTAEIILSPAREVKNLSLAGGTYTTVFLDGIIHVIVNDREEDRDLAEEIINELKNFYTDDAYGLMFLDEKNLTLVPYVYVEETKTLIREGSCGSGTFSAGYYLNKDKNPGFKATLKQPRGSLEVKAQQVNDSLTYSIGGPVSFGTIEKVEFDL